MQRNPTLEAALSASAHLRTLMQQRWWGRRRFVFQVKGQALERPALQEALRALPDSAMAQASEVFRRLVREPSKGRHVLALEAICSRYIPAASLESNLAMFQAERFYARRSELEAARDKARKALATAPSPSKTPAESPLPPGLVEVVQKAERIAWIIGAGLSVAAGIPTYRGASGLYKDRSIEKLVTLPSYLANPDLVWAFMNEKKRVMLSKEPTAAHRAMAQVGEGKEHCAITQNVDGLERRAGVPTIQLHGGLAEYKCLKEEKFLEAPSARYNDESFPICPDCGSLLKPGVVFFFEGLPAQRFDRALDVLADADVVFEVGTSHTVYPVAHMWRFAKNKGATLVVVNTSIPDGMEEADFRLEGDCQEVLVRLAGAVLGGGSLG